MSLGILKVKGWLAVSGVLLFAAGASLGFLAATFRGDDEGRRADDEAEPHAALPDATSVTGVTNSKVWDLLNLGEAQRAQADRILNAHFQKMKHLRGEWDLLGQKVESDILALLDEGQREQMAVIIRQIKFNEVAGRASQRLGDLRRELKLNVQDEEAIYPQLVSDLVDKDLYFRSLRERHRRQEKVDHQEVVKAVEKMNDALREKLRPILSEEQLCKFRDIEKRWQVWGGEGRSRQPSGSPASTLSKKPAGPESPPAAQPDPPKA